MRTLVLATTVVLLQPMLPASSGNAEKKKRTPMATHQIVENFGACMEGARGSGSTETTSNHYCGCIVDSERDHALRVSGPRKRAETIHAERRCVRHAFNQPKKSSHGIATSSAFDTKRIGSASVVAQVAACEQAGRAVEACRCAAERSRELFADKGRKKTSALLGKTGYLTAELSECEK